MTAAIVEAIVNGLVAFGLLWGGYRLGRRSGCRVGPDAKPTPADPLALVCSCGHGPGKHPGGGGHCGGTTTVRKSWNGPNYPYSRFADEILQCACTNYDGPDPDTVRLMRGA